MKRNRVPSMDLRQVQLLMREFAPLQRRLRSAVIAQYRKELEEGQTQQAIVRRVGVHSGEFRAYVNEHRIVLSGRLIDAMAKFVHDADLGHQLKERSFALKDVRSSLLAVALCPQPSIELAFDIHRAFGQNANCPIEMFASVFEPHQAIIQGVLNWKYEDVERLSDDRLSTLIIERLCDDLSSRFAAIQANAAEELRVPAAELDALCRKLLLRYTFLNDVAKALGVHSSTLLMARTGRAVKATTEKLLAKAKMLMNEDEGVTGNAPPSTAIDDESELSVQASADLDPDSGSEPSVPQEVVSVLTEQSFRLIPWIPTDAEIEAMGVQMAVVCANLNLLAQMKSDRDRERVRLELSGRVVELHSALRLFTAAHPSQLTALVDAERRTLASMPRTTRVQTVRKGRK